MSEKRFVFGTIASVIWLVVWGFLLSRFELPSQLNLWGDFLAGLFAPLAFLWLVLGYLQQGDELRQSTKALELQAQELKNSVEQQGRLVAVSQQQLTKEIEALNEERTLRREAARPKFVPQSSGSVTSGGITTYKMKIVNVGNVATSFRMQFAPPLERPKIHNLALVSRDDVLPVDLRFAADESSLATIHYIDADGIPGEIQFTIALDARKRLVIGEVQRIA